MLLGGGEHFNFSFAVFFLMEPLFYHFGFLFHSSCWYSFSVVLPLEESPRLASFLSFLMFCIDGLLLTWKCDIHLN